MTTHAPFQRKKIKMVIEAFSIPRLSCRGTKDIHRLADRSDKMAGQGLKQLSLSHFVLSVTNQLDC